MNEQQFKTSYEKSLNQSNNFWEECAQTLSWIKPWTTVASGDFYTGEICWFSGGELNVSVNCIDRHLPQNANHPALIWEGDEPEAAQIINYQQLLDRVCQFANILKKYDIGKGDRVCIYLPNIPEAAIAMLACARIGAVHAVIFGGFSAEVIKHCIVDANCKLLITTDTYIRGGQKINFRREVDKAVKECSCLNTILFVKAQEPTKIKDNREVYWQDVASSVDSWCKPEAMPSESPFFILYTSGSTGKPKGILHTTAGYLLYATLTHKILFDLKSDDIFWCTADVGWITGHSYLVYGPLANGITTVMFGGTPNYPDAGRLWQVVDKHCVSIFYTAPTVVRMLMAAGDKFLQSSNRNSLRILGSVGEPINPEAWRWYFNKIGQGRCPIIDTYWQTETGGVIIAPPVEINLQKAGAAMRPFWGIEPILLDDKGHEIHGAGEGALAIKHPWPGMLRTIYCDHERFLTTYLKYFPGYYFTGDKARRDGEGDYWILGRMDDVLNVAGHRLGTADIESALVLHEAITEAGVVGMPDPIKGEAIVAFIALMKNHSNSLSLLEELNRLVRQEIGPIASIKYLVIVPELPKTRSGKIMRRILRKIVHGEGENLGDISALNNPECIHRLISSWSESTSANSILRKK